MNRIGDALRDAIGTAAVRLRAISDESAGHAPSPGKWSPKQVIGHLIDSASNNHQRFVRAQLQDDMVFPGYQQDVWVALQQYQNAPWVELLDLWYLANRHLARVIDAVPAERLKRPCASHNLHEIAWESPLKEEPVTLEFFVVDYINHMKHHLRQIDEHAATAPLPQLRHGKRKSI